jgi:hypothetical protein
MQKLVLTMATALTLIGPSAFAQVVRNPHGDQSADIYGRAFRSGTPVTFVGRVTGIQVDRPAGAAEDDVTLLVRNRDGGGTAVVELGPKWFIDNQIAKVRVRDTVQISGRKVMVSGHGVIVASQVLLNGQGGDVLALRRPGGRAYWTGVEVTENVTPAIGPNTVSGEISDLTTYTVDNVPYAAAVIQSGSGFVTVDLGPQWYYARQNVNYHVGDYLSVVSGPHPIQVTPYLTVLPSYAVYSNSNVYTIRDSYGNPIFRH